MNKRKEKLGKNFARMFWIRAFLNLKFINIVSSLFYLHRGISLSQVYLLGLFWAGSTFVFEIPSSYLADKWGRKKTILFGSFFMFLSWIVLILAHDFYMAALSMIFYGISSASFSGTDEALVYDTAKELKREQEALEKLGRYQAAQSLFKIITPFIAALLVMDLVEWQFVLLLSLDAIACVIAFVLALLLIEPDHKMDVSKLEQGILIDGWKLIKKDSFLFRMILNKELIFFAFLSVWMYYHAYFVDLGIAITTIGFLWGLRHLIAFVFKWYAQHIYAGKQLERMIDLNNILFTVCFALFLISLVVFPNPYWLLFLFMLSSLFEAFRVPVFSDLFHKRLHSYNRATTLSLTNLIHHVLEFPIFICAAALVAMNVNYPYVLSLIIALFVIIFVPLYRKRYAKHT